MHSHQSPVARAQNGSEELPAAAYIPGVEEHRITINNVEWRYLRAGSGPALVLVHGLLGFSWSWRFNMRELAKYFTVYAPDLPGTGFSQRSDKLSGSLESDADGLISLMDALGVDRFSLVGSSRGGGVAIVVAGLLAKRGLLYRLERMILCAPISPWSKFGQRRVRWLAAPLGRQFVIHVVPRLHSVMEMYYRDMYGDPSRIAPGSVEGYAAGLLVPRTFHHLVRIVSGWHPDLRQVEAMLPLLQELPTLLLWGSRDTVVYPASARELHDRLANSAMLTMEGAGHLPYEELPAEFNRVVCEFLLQHHPQTALEMNSPTTATSRVEGAATPAGRDDRQQPHFVG